MRGNYTSAYNTFIDLIERVEQSERVSATELSRLTLLYWTINLNRSELTPSSLGVLWRGQIAQRRSHNMSCMSSLCAFISIASSLASNSPSSLATIVQKRNEGYYETTPVTPGSGGSTTTGGEPSRINSFLSSLFSSNQAVATVEKGGQEIDGKDKKESYKDESESKSKGKGEDESKGEGQGQGQGEGECKGTSSDDDWSRSWSDTLQSHIDAVTARASPCSIGGQFLDEIKTGMDMGDNDAYTIGEDRTCGSTSEQVVNQVSYRGV